MKRTETPEPIRRILRQEAGFGCCRCGCSILDYHHIIPWRIEQHFRPEDMIALCPTCHRLAGEGNLSVREQRHLKVNPINCSSGRAKGRIVLRRDVVAIDVGAGVDLVGERVAIKMFDKTVLECVEDGTGHLSLSTELYDAGGSCLLRVVENDWFCTDSLPWDLERRPHVLIIRSAARNIAMEIHSDRFPVRLRGSWYWRRVAMHARESIALVGNAGFKNMTVVGMSFDVNRAGTSLGPQGQPGFLIGYDNRMRRLNEAIKIVKGWRAGKYH